MKRRSCTILQTKKIVKWKLIENKEVMREEVMWQQ